MANTDLAFRFTEDLYASKTEVMKALNTSLVDNIWANILAYRKTYFKPLGLFTFSKSEYYLCACQYIISKNAQMEMKLLKVMRELSSVNPEDYSSLEYYCYLNLLKSVAKNEELDSSEVRMRSILRNEVKYLDEANSILPRYIDALNYLKRHYTNNIDIAFIQTLHRFLIGNDDSYLRVKNDEDRSNKVLIGRNYTSAPFNLIEPLMTDLCNFINNTVVEPIIRSYIVYFYTVMVKPFDRYSDEIALLLAKAVLARDSIGELAVLLPLENIFVEAKENMTRLLTDAQKYNDVTYFVRYGLDFQEPLINNFIDYIVRFKTQYIKEEFFGVDEEEAPKEVIKEQREEKVVPQVKEIEPVKDAGEMAINIVIPQIDEKEAQKLEQYLLESDPSLKKGEARFYARHCRLGMNYTIQQYKKFNHCVYETARTSMDHLAELGYYRKEQVKNKFIYSPVNRRN